MITTIKSFLCDESGATAIEYALIGTLVVVTLIGAFFIAYQFLKANLQSALLTIG